MTRLPYPGAFAELGEWAAMADVSRDAARNRFAQFAVLAMVASVPELRRGLVFKGGNALDFIWESNRSTIDLDFTVDATVALTDLTVDVLRRYFQAGIVTVRNELGVLTRVQSIRPNPNRPNLPFVTYAVTIGYALPDQQALLQRMARDQDSPQVIRLDVSTNDPIGGDQEVQLQPGFAIRVATPEDIVAEKLRALLQQPIRNRQRRQDLLDIAVIVTNQPDLDRTKIARFLLIKAAARDVPVSRAAFHAPAVAELAQRGYDALAATTRTRFVPFDEALVALFDLVDTLDIPAT